MPPLFALPAAVLVGGFVGLPTAAPSRWYFAKRWRAKIALITRAARIDDESLVERPAFGLGIATGQEPTAGRSPRFGRPGSIGENGFGRSDRRASKPRIDAPVGASAS